MPYGSFTFSPYPPASALDATPVGVFLYDPTVDPDGGEEDDGENSPWYTLLPNVRCEQIQYKEGVEPPTARFFVLPRRHGQLAKRLAEPIRQHLAIDGCAVELCRRQRDRAGRAGVSGPDGTMRPVARLLARPSDRPHSVVATRHVRRRRRRDSRLGYPHRLRFTARAPIRSASTTILRP